jgi:hypothetical protein
MAFWNIYISVFKRGSFIGVGKFQETENLKYRPKKSNENKHGKREPE